MNTYPLIRNRWSNEHLLTVLFIVVSLYQLPDWMHSPAAIPGYILVAAAALLLDAALNLLRYKRPVCSVSAAVTAAVLYPLIKSLPGWAGLLGIAAALIIGKHTWGGTGKNIFNPAVIGMFMLSIFFPLGFPIFEPSDMLLPALLLSIPFICVRIFPGIGLLAGMLLLLLVRNSLDYSAIISYGIIFWSCVVITDPVTSTDKPVAGIIAGFMAGFLPLYFNNSLFAFTAAILLFNGVSFLLNSFSRKNTGVSLSGIRIKPPARAAGNNIEMTDFTGKQPGMECDSEYTDRESIFEHIRRNDVFGMGGAGFPVIEKLEAVTRSGAKEKYLIINGMECDPGLIHDKWLMKNRQLEIAKGAAVLGKLVEFKKIYCITKEKDGFSLPEPVEMYPLPDRYPYGAERLFVEKLLGISIPNNSNPAQYGVLVLNIQTVLSVYEAVCCDEKADTRFLTVADLFDGTNRVVRVKLEERIGDIVNKTVGSKGMTFVGGGIMQARAAAADEVVGKKINFIAVGMLPKYKESPQCINCGLCKLCCPMGLEVVKIADLVEEGRALEAQAFNSGSCISCGICSYVCMAGRNLSGRLAKRS